MEDSSGLVIRNLKGVTGRFKEPLAALGIKTVKDLLFHFPHRYEDYAVGVSLADAKEGDNIVVEASVVKVANRRGFGRRRMSTTEAQLTDGETEMGAVWFNQPYLVKTLAIGRTYRFSGKVSRISRGIRLINPSFVKSESVMLEEGDGALMPVYPLTTGITVRTIRKLMRNAKPYVSGLVDSLPSTIAERYKLNSLIDAVNVIHFPEDRESLFAARRRIAFDEVFHLQLAVGMSRQEREKGRANAIPFTEQVTKDFVGSLPFKLTNDQRIATWDIIRDMEKARPMQRLLDGDVGSGKTVVSAIVARNAAEAGFQTAIMAPTEILALQHFRSFTTLFANTGIRIVLWTNAYKVGSIEGKEIVYKGAAAQKELAAEIESGEITIVIGTHALIEKSFSFHRLGLAVIDEQHRFGVNTRKALMDKGGRNGLETHLLSMTATPIPRTLALTVYGDLDISLLKEKPAGRKEIKTKVISPRSREKTYTFIRQQIEKGRQVFFVCPLIDPSEMVDARSVTELHKFLSEQVFSDMKLEMLHGKLHAKDKERIMKSFGEGSIDILVSTSVVEVGVDVPNATVMCIEGAERFGLAQLHQFRGRVGRSLHASYCFLFPTDAGKSVSERLRIMETVDDGFSLAEKDLKIRGSGNILGTDQSGFMTGLKVASLDDMQLVSEAREAALSVLTEDPGLLRYPKLKSALNVAFKEAHLE